MSLWKFNGFEAEVDFTDADFLDALDDAKKELDEAMKSVPKVGKNSDIVRAQCKCFYRFFDVLFYEGAGNDVYQGRHSLDLCIKSAESLTELQNAQNKQYDNYDKYRVQTHKKKPYKGKK